MQTFKKDTADGWVQTRLPLCKRRFHIACKESMLRTGGKSRHKPTNIPLFPHAACVPPQKIFSPPTSRNTFRSLFPPLLLWDNSATETTKAPLPPFSPLIRHPLRRRRLDIANQGRNSPTKVLFWTASRRVVLDWRLFLPGVRGKESSPLIQNLFCLQKLLVKPPPSTAYKHSDEVSEELIFKRKKVGGAASVVPLLRSWIQCFVPLLLFGQIGSRDEANQSLFVCVLFPPSYSREPFYSNIDSPPRKITGALDCDCTINKLL